MVILHGIGVTKKLCYGRLKMLHKTQYEITNKKSEDITWEMKCFEEALLLARKQLEEIAKGDEHKLDSQNAGIFHAQGLILEDEGFLQDIRQMILNDGYLAEYAVQQIGNRFIDKLKDIKDEMIRQRVGDIRDVSERVLRLVLFNKGIVETNEGKIGEANLENPCILVAEDLLPSEMLLLDQCQILGLALKRGSKYSHTAILAKGMDIPTVFDLGDELLEEYQGKWAILDGYNGELILDPTEDVIRATEERKEKLSTQNKQLAAFKSKEAITLKGKKIQLHANAGSILDVERAEENGAEGIGLFRSEILYLGATKAPDEELQFTHYKQILQGMQGKEVTIRTLDIGVDKNPQYCPKISEENPALGLRAIRLGFRYEELLKTQLRALYRASVYGKLKIMYPMITSCEEILRIHEVIKEVKLELSEQQIPYKEDVPMGIMIETPAAALISDELAGMVDFFSVGTNDLTQYTLAVDRQNENVREFWNPHHKGILRLIEMATKSAHGAGIPIGICGELAADLSLTEDFVAMGIDSLSVVPDMILVLKQHICSIQ